MLYKHRMIYKNLQQAEQIKNVEKYEKLIKEKSEFYEQLKNRIDFENIMIILLTSLEKFEYSLVEVLENRYDPEKIKGIVENSFQD